MRRYEQDVRLEEYPPAIESLKAAGFRLMLSSANLAYFNAIGLDPKDATTKSNFLSDRSGRYREGDLIAAPDWSEIAYIGLYDDYSSQTPGEANAVTVTTGPAKHYIEIGAVTKDGESKFLSPIKDAVAQGLQAFYSGKGKWSRLSWGNEKFSALSSKGSFQKVDLGVQQRNGAELLLQKDFWKLSTAVKASGGMLLKNFEQINGGSEQVSRLVEAGMLRKEHVVVCKNTSALMNRIPSIDVLAALDSQGVRCGSCGRRLSEERCDEFLSPTDLSKELLDHSRWMAVLLADRLRALGIEEDRILLEFREGSEEVDSFVDIDSQLLMVDLKDKEFSMGHAYALSARIALYKPDQVLIVTSDRVAPDVKSYFEQVKPEARLTYVEGLSNLAVELNTSANIARSEKATTILEYFDPLTLCLLYTSPSPRDLSTSRMPSSA